MIYRSKVINEFRYRLKVDSNTVFAYIESYFIFDEMYKIILTEKMLQIEKRGYFNILFTMKGFTFMIESTLLCIQNSFNKKISPIVQ